MIRRSAWPLATFAFALLAIAAHVRAQDDEPLPPPPPPWTGARWEYQVFRLDPADYADMDDWKEILAENGNDWLRAEAPFHTHVLQSLGQDGWELVDVERPRANLVHFYLKRPGR
jgi:hypothetical protein